MKKRTINTTVRYTPEEHEQATETARNADLPLADLQRRLVLNYKVKGRKPVPKIDPEAGRLLGYWSSLFNQYMYIANAKKKNGWDIDAAEMILIGTQALETLQEIRDLITRKKGGDE